MVSGLTALRGATGCHQRPSLRSDRDRSSHSTATRGRGGRENQGGNDPDLPRRLAHLEAQSRAVSGRPVRGEPHAEASDRFNVGLLFVAHDTKAARSETRRGGDPGAGAVAGSGVWFDAARAVVYLFTLGATGERLLQALKVNNGQAGWGRALDAIGGSNTEQPFAGFRADGDDLDPDAAMAMRSEWEAASTRDAIERETRAKAEGRAAAKGLQRPGGRGGVGSGPSGSAPDPAGAAVGRFRLWRGGRSVRSADACCDSGLAVVAWRSADGVSGRSGVRSAADGWRVRARGAGGSIAFGPRGAAIGPCGQRGAGEPVLAIDREQHEPGGVRGVSGAVPERGIQRAGAGAAGGSGSTSEWFTRSGRARGRRGRVSDYRVTSLRLSGLRHGCAGPRHSGWRRCASASGGGVPGLRGVSGDGDAAGGRSGPGSLRGDGRRVSSVRVGDGRRWERLRRWRFVAGPQLSADGWSSGDVRELGRRAGVRVVAEPDDGCDVSAADRGGMGTRKCATSLRACWPS